MSMVPSLPMSMSTRGHGMPADTWPWRDSSSEASDGTFAEYRTRNSCGPADPETGMPTTSPWMWFENPT
jgi:hypothetical protein